MSSFRRFRFLHSRLIERTMSWDSYVRLAFDELRLAGAASPQVARRLRAALEDILTVAPPERRRPLEHQLHLLEAGVRRAYEDDADVRTALVGDLQGIGSGPDVMSAGGSSERERMSRHNGRTAVS